MVFGDSCLLPISQGFKRLLGCSYVYIYYIHISLQGNPISRLTRMNQAAELFLIQIIEKGSLVGLVTFDSTATIQNLLARMTSEKSYLEISANLPRQVGNGTSICNGLRSGFQVKKEN